MTKKYIKIEKRQDHQPPAAITKFGWKFHHLGIPIVKRMTGEQYLKHLKIHVAGFETSPYGIQWMRFDKDCPISKLIKTVPHLAFEVDNLEEALVGKKIINDINSPSEGIRVAMIVDNGAPVELIEFQKNKKSIK